MPLTPSHAIVALPFVRTPLPAAAVAVGAMTPDVPLFVRGLPLSYEVTHDLRWVPATVVLAFALLLLWRCVLRPAWRELSPRWLAARLPAAWDAGAAVSLRRTVAPGRRGAGILLLVAALAIGVVSHIVWDSFTHEGRAGTVLIPAIAQSWGPLAGYKWLQYGSSVVGLVVLAVAAIVWLRGRAPEPVPRMTPWWVRVLWWVSAVVPLAIGTGVVLSSPSPLRAEQIAYGLLPSLYTVWAVLTIALCLVVRARSRAARA